MTNTGCFAIIRNTRPREISIVFINKPKYVLKDYQIWLVAESACDYSIFETKTVHVKISALKLGPSKLSKEVNTRIR